MLVMKLGSPPHFAHAGDLGSEGGLLFHGALCIEQHTTRHLIIVPQAGANL
jgi:hypothetical protein